MMQSHSRYVSLVLAVIALAGVTGCPVVSNLPAPGRILTLQEPDANRAYYLYKPTGYRDDRAWPLVVSCHGTEPFDTAKSQLKTWKGLAEREGFLLAAPELVGTATRAFPSPAEQIERQMRDERAILSMVRAIRGANTVNDDQIFLTGWSAGGYAVLFTGLRHPELFRALSTYQGNFNAAFVEPCIPYLDRHQPVQIVYGIYDPIDDSQACLEWLRSHGMQPDVFEQTGIHQRGPEPVFAFFSQVVRDRPAARIVVEDDADDAMTVTLQCRASFEPGRFRWDFGDGEGSTDARPRHTYTQPGAYKIRVAVWSSPKHYVIREMELQIPRVRLGARPATTTSAP